MSNGLAGDTNLLVTTDQGEPLIVRVFGQDATRVAPRSRSISRQAQLSPSIRTGFGSRCKREAVWQRLAVLWSPERKALLDWRSVVCSRSNMIVERSCSSRTF